MRATSFLQIVLAAAHHQQHRQRALNSATLLGYGDNNVDGNGTDGMPTGTIPTK